jgi:hypothetical protein
MRRLPSDAYHGSQTGPEDLLEVKQRRDARLDRICQGGKSKLDEIISDSFKGTAVAVAHSSRVF